MARGLLIIRTCSNYWLLCVGDASAARFFPSWLWSQSAKKIGVISRQKTNKPWGVERMRPLVSCVLVCWLLCGLFCRKEETLQRRCPLMGGKKANERDSAEWRTWTWWKGDTSSLFLASILFVCVFRRWSFSLFLGKDHASPLESTECWMK